MRTLLASLATSGLLLAQGPVTPAPGAANPLATAQAFLDLVRTGKGPEAHARLDATMAAALTPIQLEQIWRQMEGQLGPCKGLGTATLRSSQGFQVVTTPVTFGDTSLNLITALNAQGQVVGFRVVPGAAPQNAAPAPLPKGLTARDVTVGSDPFKLPGTLLLPEGKGPFPAVVLVHGSGPNDRDETVGPNKPFRDLAQGLAQRGIAVLHYDKRTRVHAARLDGSLTLQEETVLDAAQAVRQLQATPGLLPGKVFVLGHSLGGMALPRIARQVPTAAGLISLAGPSRPMEDLILEQVQLQGASADALASLRTQVARVKSKDLTASTPADQLPLGLPAPYWLDLRGYAPAREALALPHPLLLLQGGRDCQVLEADIALWESTLRGRKDVTVRRFPGLNHLFMPAPVGSKGEEYQKPGQVDPQVIDTLATWILAH